VICPTAQAEIFDWRGLDNPNRLDPAREIAVYAQAIWTVRVLASIAASAFSGAISVLVELKNRALLFCFDAVSSREPVSTSLENALRCCLGMIFAHTHAFVVRGSRFPLFRIML
jgi:hypothetical protein